MEDERMKRACDLAQEATVKDRAGQYEDAFELYKLSLEHFHLVCKYQRNPQLKQRLVTKMLDYVSRAEQIKKYLAEKTEQETSTPLIADTQKPGGAGGDEAGGENEKLKNSLASAIVKEKPNVQWSDVAGLEGAKEALQEAAIFPTRFPTLFVGDRKPWKGILLYGPPGTGKTFLAKACANEVDATFLSVSSALLISKWQGESERLVKAMFESAREHKPAIVFVDEVDSMCTSRSDGESESSRRIKTEFLVQMDGLGNDSQGVLILGATNVPWELDAAIRRRFERRIYVPLPDWRGRRKMFELGLNKTPHSLIPSDFQRLAEVTEGFSGADISIVVRDALFQPLRKCRAATHFKRIQTKDGKPGWTPCAPGDRDPSKEERALMSIPGPELVAPDVSMSDFEAVMAHARPAVSSEEIKKHEEWTAKFGLEG